MSLRLIHARCPDGLRCDSLFNDWITLSLEERKLCYLGLQVALRLLTENRLEGNRLLFRLMGWSRIFLI